MSIHTLLQAAEYIERREREAEHGYASTMPIPADIPKKKPKAKKTQGNRTTHNELEKNRRGRHHGLQQQPKRHGRPQQHPEHDQRWGHGYFDQEAVSRRGARRLGPALLLLLCTDDPPSFLHLIALFAPEHHASDGT